MISVAQARGPCEPIVRITVRDVTAGNAVIGTVVADYLGTASVSTVINSEAGHQLSFSYEIDGYNGGPGRYQIDYESLGTYRYRHHSYNGVMQNIPGYGPSDPWYDPYVTPALVTNPDPELPIFGEYKFDYAVHQCSNPGIFRVDATITIVDDGIPTNNLTRKEVGTTLAVIKRPTVDLKVNGQSSVQVPVGATPNLTWTTDSVSNGNSCWASNSYGDSNWAGPTNGPGGGSQLVGPMTNEGIFTYHILCYGFGNSSAQSQVQIQVGPGGDDFALLCSPIHHPDILIGSSASYNLSTSPIGGFNSQVTIRLHNTNFVPSGVPGDFDYPQVILNPDNAQVPPSETVAMVNTGPSVGLGLYTYTFRATGGGRTHDCIVDVAIVPENVEPPTPPQLNADSTRECEKVYITFASSGLPTPTSYKLYRGRPFTGTLLQTYGAGERLVYVDTYPGAQTSDNFYYVIAYNGNTPSQPALTGPANVRLCLPQLGNSDKDLIKVQGKFTKEFPANPCSGSGNPNPVVLPQGAIFAVGDLLTFEIHVCNTGEREANNVQVTDRLYNMGNPDTYDNLQSPQFLSSVGSSGGACATESGKTNNTINFSVNTLAAGSTCTIKFSARLVKPANPTGSVYRFQNTGVITASNHDSVPYYTPPYLFNLTGIPEREEIPPQN